MQIYTGSDIIIVNTYISIPKFNKTTKATHGDMNK